MRPKTGDDSDDKYQQALNDRDGCASDGAPDHNLDARHGSDQSFLKETKLAVPQHGDSRKNRREKNGHADNPGRYKLKVAALPCLLKNRPEPKAKRKQVEQWLAKRSRNLRA